MLYFSAFIILAQLSQALVIEHQQPDTGAIASASFVTLTSTFSSTVTNTIVTATPVVTLGTTCTFGTRVPSGATCAPSLWSLTGGNYYSQFCSASLVGGTIIRAYVEPVGAAATSICVSFCNALNNIHTPASSCNGIVFTTIGALYQCLLNNGVVTSVPAPASVFAIQHYTTNPCVTTVTSLSTETVFATTTSIYEVTYTNTVLIAITTDDSSSTTVSSSTTLVSSSTSKTTSSTTSLSTISSSTTSSSATSSSATSSSLTFSSSTPAPVSTITSTTSTISSFLSLSVPSSAWIYAGCYTEATSKRALSDASFFSDLMNVEQCAKYCSPYPIFGVEYGRECYCGRTLNEGSVSAMEAECNFDCPGSATQKCGAGNRLNVYKKPSATLTTSTMTFSTRTPLPTSYGALGCYSDPVNPRALKSKSYNDDAMTVEKCAAACLGYRYFGLEYYFECYCGDEVQGGSVRVDPSECKFPCKGDASQTCGASSRMNLYGFGNSPETPPTPAVTALVTTTASQSPTSSAYPGYFTTGCYTEALNQRALSGGSHYDDSMTVELCASVCTGYALFGVEYGRECYCGNILNSGSIITSTELCNFQCPGNRDQFCGAGNRLNVYEYGVQISPSSVFTVQPTTVYVK